MGGAWLIDKGMTAYEAWQDIKALEAGTTTLEELAIAKGEDYIMQVVAGNMGKYGMKAVKKAGGWVAEKVGHHSDDVVITAPSPLDPGKLAPRADGLPVERVQAGSKGNWDKTVNGDLKPKTAYELNNGHTYVTDASGRVNSVEGQLSLTTMDRNPYQQCKVGHCGNAGDDGGHLIASSLGGAGDKINMVPQAAKLNRGDWKRMENEMRTALQSGQTVSVKIDMATRRRAACGRTSSRCWRPSTAGWCPTGLRNDKGFE
ncbi:hypothetical protein G3435_14355 [Pseudomonas sp. MAFF212428]|uniref:Type VII secretion system protein EssD-like domain-containing protein n=1 Tax=Pseudomonas brassicae TaxID=2708063 RepID=A0A6M0CTP4_9PSED|nr:hypothetical protein [Pseudomonas brassicae]